MCLFLNERILYGRKNIVGDLCRAIHAAPAAQV